MLLAVENLKVSYDRIKALHGISFHIDEGEIVCIIGANGAGKTSILRTISGLLRAKSGQIMYQPDANGEKIDISRMSAERIVNLGLCHCPEGRGIFSQLSVRENLLVGAYLNKDKQALADDYKHVCEIFPILGERTDQAGGSLSGGEQEMLAVGRALMSRPQLLILDEPSLGLGPIIVDNLFAILRQINAQGVTILLVEQNAVMALEYADRAYVLENGRVTLSGPSRELAEDGNVRRAYLGGV